MMGHQEFNSILGVSYTFLIWVGRVHPPCFQAQRPGHAEGPGELHEPNVMSLALAFFFFVRNRSRPSNCGPGVVVAGRYPSCLVSCTTYVFLRIYLRPIVPSIRRFLTRSGILSATRFFRVWLINLCLLVVQCSRFDRVLTKLLQCCRIAPVCLKSYLRGYGGQPTATALRDETDNEM